MSDPRYTDPRYVDPRRPTGVEPDAPRPYDFEEPSSGGSTWTWLAAIAAIIVVLGLAIGYNRTEQASNPSTEPTTTGAAPAAPRPAAPSNSVAPSTLPSPPLSAPADSGNGASLPVPARPTPAPAEGNR
jgi:hypothetical protein